MAAVGPHGGDRRVAVAVSGGADSMALALLLAGWGRPHALVVDHGLRAGSAAEAAVTAGRLTEMRIPSEVLTLSLSPQGPRAGRRGTARVTAEEARIARYAALEAACARVGLPDLVLGHHAQDQAETIAIRRERGSGPAGLAGMAPVTHTNRVRRLRPLLSIDPACLRATLRAAGVAWVEDPSNFDPATPRARLRARGRLPAVDGQAARHRYEAERDVAAELAALVDFHPCGVALVRAPALSPAALSALVWTLGGQPHPPRPAAVAALAARLRPATLGGAAILRRRDGWWIGREAAAMAPATAGVGWDDRFRRASGPGTLGPVGADASRLRARSLLPAALLRTVPAVRDGGLFAVPHLAYPGPETCGSLVLAFCPPRPAAPAPFAVT